MLIPVHASSMSKNNSHFPGFAFSPLSPNPSRKEAIFDLQIEKFRLQLGVVQKKSQAVVEPCSHNSCQIQTRTTRCSSCSCQPRVSWALFKNSGFGARKGLWFCCSWPLILRLAQQVRAWC